MDNETAEKTVLYHRNGGDYSNDLETIKSTWKKIAEYTSEGSGDIWIGEEIHDIDTGASFIKTKGSGSSTGVGDRFYWGSTSTGAREKLERGPLWSSSNAGLSCVGGGISLSNAHWSFVPCV